MGISCLPVITLICVIYRVRILIFRRDVRKTVMKKYQYQPRTLAPGNGKDNFSKVQTPDQSPNKNN